MSGPLRESHIKRGGVNCPPTTPKKNIKPPAQRPLTEGRMKSNRKSSFTEEDKHVIYPMSPPPPPTPPYRRRITHGCCLPVLAFLFFLLLLTSCFNIGGDNVEDYSIELWLHGERTWTLSCDNYSIEGSPGFRRTLWVRNTYGSESTIEISAKTEITVITRAAGKSDDDSSAPVNDLNL